MQDNYFEPLAARMRPRHVEQFIGQQHLLGKNKPLRIAIEQGHLHSMILWGPPGTGKTTLANLLANQASAEIERLSAVLSGIKDIRAMVERAQHRQRQGQRTLVFVDEVHRFNKVQQDAFLPHVEAGTFTFIGATTENPSFEINNALLSRTKVYILKSLTRHDIQQIIQHAMTDEQYGLGQQQFQLSLELQQRLAEIADGDARIALNSLEILANYSDDGQISHAIFQQVVGKAVQRFDKGGEDFYNQISALHKAVRGSAPDAALYWLARMLDAGCDPLYIARRIVRMASEDIGNADPRALTIALQAWQVQQRLGSPEGDLAIAQATLYLACAAKSNAVYTAFNAAMQDAKHYGSLDVPLRFRNAASQLMQQLDYGRHYQYAHDWSDAYVPGEHYLPDEMPNKQYYQPVERGLEKKIAAKLAYLKKKDKE